MDRTYDEANAVQRAFRRLAASGPGSWVFKRTLHHVDRVGARLVPRASRPVSAVLTGLPVGTVTTTGARTGLPRSVPLLLVPFDGGWAAVSSFYGSARTPAWASNLAHEPHAVVELHGRRHDVVATRLTGEARERMRATALAWYPGYAVYERRAGSREIGWFHLVPTGPDPGSPSPGHSGHPGHSGSPSASSR